MIGQSRELACLLDHSTCLMASDESSFTCKAASRNASSRRPRRP
jgi:hypothetical protein